MSESKQLEQLAAMLQARRNGRPIREVARQHRLSPKAYRRIELGMSRPQIRTCYRLAGLLNVEATVVLSLAGYDISEDLRAT